MPDANGGLVNEESAHQGLAAVEWTAARVGKSLYYRGVCVTPSHVRNGVFGPLKALSTRPWRY